MQCNLNKASETGPGLGVTLRPFNYLLYKGFIPDVSYLKMDPLFFPGCAEDIPSLLFRHSELCRLMNCVWACVCVVCAELADLFSIHSLYRSRTKSVYLQQLCMKQVRDIGPLNESLNSA